MTNHEHKGNGFGIYLNTAKQNIAKLKTKLISVWQDSNEKCVKLGAT
jgi:hypothetical protein